MAASFGVPFVLLWLDVPAELAARRIATDTVEAPPDRHPELAHAVADRFEAPDADEPAVRLDGQLAPAALLDAAVAAIRPA